MDLSALKLSATYHRKVWGGRKLVRYIDLPGDEAIGEVWLVADNPRGSRVIDGPLEGTELGELVRRYGQTLLGTRVGTNAAGAFPLIVKLIHSNEALSIQVHPDDDYARRHEGVASGKTEAWYILEAEPHATLTIGFDYDVTRAEVEASLREGTIERLIKPVTVKAGQSFLLPPGRIHSLGPGVVLIEIQQNGPVTYRLYDYQRKDPDTGKPRRLDVKKALDVLDYSATKQPQTEPLIEKQGRNEILTFVLCRHFCGQLLALHDVLDDFVDISSFHLLSLLSGEMEVETCQPDPRRIYLQRGESLLLPAGTGQYRLVPQNNKPVSVARSFVPDLEAMVAKLRGQGFFDRDIAALAGHSKDNDLAFYVEKTGK